MSSRRLRNRVPSATSQGIGRLRNHTLASHKISKKDGSGKCDIVASEGNDVLGVLFHIADHEKPILDKFEGLGCGYDEKEVDVIASDGSHVITVTYYATNVDSNLKPNTWYIRHIVEGAKKAGLPDPYIRTLESVEAVKDPDGEREKKELAIYS